MEYVGAIIPFLAGFGARIARVEVRYPPISQISQIFKNSFMTLMQKAYTTERTGITEKNNCFELLCAPCGLSGEKLFASAKCIYHGESAEKFK